MLDITAEDRIAIHETIALHGHLADGREWDRLGEVFAADVVFDVTDYGYGTLHGLQAVQDPVRGSRDEAAEATVGCPRQWCSRLQWVGTRGRSPARRHR